MDINLKLKNYIVNNIYPLYKNNYIGDNIDRIDYVLNRSETIIKENNLDINDNILYTIISYHDLRNDNYESNHELYSAEKMYRDENLKDFFSEEERIIIKEAIEDQRAKSDKEPRSIYGKVLSSASRNSSVEQSLKRSYLYGKKKNPNLNDDEIFEGSYDALNNKFGENGYAQFYFKDSVYEQFLKDIRVLLSDKETFIKKQREYINELKNRGEI